MKEEIMAVKKEINELKEQSLAMEMLKDSKKANIKICIIFAVTLTISIIIQFITMWYLIHVLNSINTEVITEEESTTQEIHDIDNIDNSYIINGDNYGNN